VVSLSIPVEVLIDEHKLILKAVATLKQKVAQTELNKSINPDSITLLVDFFRMYADRFHHGKEEGILFSELSLKELTDSDKTIMNELIGEHVFARKTVTSLENAKQDYVNGKRDAINTIIDLLQVLAKLYPVHIEKEDKHFFYPAMAYFDKEEQQNMRRKFEEFNRTFTDKRYSQIINSLK
jgi:hemerythrin-like domain-containing protein